MTQMLESADKIFKYYNCVEVFTGKDGQNEWKNGKFPQRIWSPIKEWNGNSRTEMKILIEGLAIRLDTAEEKIRNLKTG